MLINVVASSNYQKYLDQHWNREWKETNRTAEKNDKYKLSLVREQLYDFIESKIVCSAGKRQLSRIFWDTIQESNLVFVANIVEGTNGKRLKKYAF